MPKDNELLLNMPGRIINSILFWFAVIGVLFHFIAVTFIPVDPWVLRGAHLFFASVIVFMGSMVSKEGSLTKGWFLSLVLTLASILVGFYIFLEYPQLYYRVGINPTQLDVIIGLIAIIALLEMTRRLIGIALPIIAICFILYALFGSGLPGLLGHRGYSLSDLVSLLFSIQGIYGIPLNASATLAILFITFGAFLNASGTGEFFINLAFSITGRLRGGPAKAAVVSSSLMGTISGNAVSNVVTTGTFTIPLMIKTGYLRHFAGAVEAVSSAGGQIMPPVMGTAAFIMAEFLGVPYAEIVIAAVIPALLYYLAVYLNVDFEAARLGLKGLKAEELPKLWEILKKQGYLLLPILVLIYFLLIVHSSTIKAAMFSILASILISYLGRSSRMTPGKIVKALSNGMNGVLNVAAATATAGIIIGVMTLTGLGLRLASVVLALVGNNLFVVMFLTMVIALILGMGMPTAPSYIIAASVAAPAMVKLGVPELAAHLFVFYFAVISTITPPVCLSAFAGAGIAGANPMKTGFTAAKIGLAAFLVPYAFAFNSVLLLKGSPGEILLAVVTSIVGIYSLARGLSYPGHNVLERSVLIVGSVLMVIPGFATDVPGLLLVVIGHLRFFIKLLFSRRASKVEM